jgi:hypothetical protein
VDEQAKQALRLGNRFDVNLVAGQQRQRVRQVVWFV